LENNFLRNINAPFTYLRYIDDIFIIWTDTEDALHNFINSFNRFHKNIKFTSHVSKTEINFLDVTVSISDSTISTKVYRKPTDSPQYLHFQSEHPKHIKTALPYSLLSRCKRICTKDSDFENNIHIIKSRFQDRGYPSEILNDAVSKI